MHFLDADFGLQVNAAFENPHGCLHTLFHFTMALQFSAFAEFSIVLSIAGLVFTALGTFWKMFTFFMLMLEYYEMQLCILLHIYTLVGKWALHKHIQTVQIVLKNE